MSQEMQPVDRSLAECEAVIERGLGTFVEVGQALLEIRDARLYRESHLTFQDYCRDRWGWGLRRAEQMMQAARVVGVLADGEAQHVAPPSNPRQATELARLPEPEAVREVWHEVKEEHGDSVTAADVRQAVDRRLGIERSAAAPPAPALAPPPPAVAPEPERLAGVTNPEPKGIHRTSVLETPVGEGEPDWGIEGESHPESAAELSVPNTQRMRDAHLRAEFARCVTRAAQLAAYSPERIAEVLPPDRADSIEQALDRLGDWLQKFKSCRTRGLRVVGG